MGIRAFHVIIDAPPEAVFDYVQDLGNLPSWCFHFCKGIRLVAEGAIVRSPMGEVYFGTTGDRDLGVIDWWCGPTMETAERWPTRVIGLPDGRSLYHVTAIFNGPVPPTIEQHFAEELDALKRLVEEHAAYAWEFGGVTA
jgi:hypothetical protein